MTEWHVLTVQPQRELAVALRLVSYWPVRRGPAPRVYVPQYLKPRTTRKLPMFPGYVLAEYAGHQRQWISGQWITGILHGEVTEAEIEQVRALEASGAVPTEAMLRPGDACEITLHGCSVEARYVRSEGESAEVAVEILGRVLVVRVQLESVRVA